MCEYRKILLLGFAQGKARVCETVEKWLTNQIRLPFAQGGFGKLCSSTDGLLAVANGHYMVVLGNGHTLRILPWRPVGTLVTSPRY